MARFDRLRTALRLLAVVGLVLREVIELVRAIAGL